MKASALIFIALGLAQSFALGCGLDWTLPTNHFDGVNEQGYVSSWEKIGEADLGDGLVIPVNINFNSHRETSSPTLGKGWMVALLESHVEPVDENSMKVVMPDGWNFYFYRNGSSEIWRGNAGWVGETKDSIFWIKAPCGAGIKFDGGKIQEIDTNKNRTLTYRYNGGVATEVDENNRPFVQVQSSPTPGAPAELLIGGQKIYITQAQRPRIRNLLKQNLVTGFDPSLSELQWPDGRKESFAFGTDKGLNPTLLVTHSDHFQTNFTWNSHTRIVKQINDFTYTFYNENDAAMVARIDPKGNREFFGHNFEKGLTITGANSTMRKEWRFVSGSLSGKVRRIECIDRGQITKMLSYSFDEMGNVIRESGFSGKWQTTRRYAPDRSSVSTLTNGEITVSMYYNESGEIIATKF